MKPHHYQITIKNGKYLHEYNCSLFIELHLWRFKYWYLIKTQRGSLVHICKMAHQWSKMLSCDVVDRTIDEL